ncbi:MAG: DUF748 domain-containing protein, partial [Deltaproteobacteria bacterium]|nr:DUF748 domain-containing protein [Deltaproteobacteria bacterium]
MDANQNSASHFRSAFLKRILKGILLVFLGLLVIFGGLLAYVRFGLEGRSVARLVVPRLETALGKRIWYSSAHLSWPSMKTGRIAFTDMNVTEPDNSTPLLRIPHAVFEVSLASVWRGKLIVSLAEFSGPLLTLRRDRHAAIGGQQDGTDGFPLVLASTEVNELRIRGGHVAFVDPEGKYQSDEAVFSEITCTAKDVFAKGASDLELQGTVASRATKGLFQVSGSVDLSGSTPSEWLGQVQVRARNCPVPTMRAIVSYFGPELPISNGTLDFTGYVSNSGGGLEAKGELRAARVVLARNGWFLHDVKLETAEAAFAAVFSKDSVQIIIAGAELPGLSVSVEARIGNLSHDDPTVTVAVTNAELDLEKIFPILPLKLMTMEDRRRLLEAGLKGRVQITGGAWTGKLSDFSSGLGLQGTLGMEVLLDKVSGFVPRLGLPVEHASGQVKVKGDEILFKGISLTLGSSPIVLNGWITDLRNSPRTDLFISMDAQAQDLRPILENKAVAASLRPWIGRIIDPSGRVIATLDLKGNLRRPAMKGKIDLRDFQCAVEGFGLPVKKVNGSMRFRTTGVTFSQIEGVIGTSLVSLHGNLAPDNVEISGEAKTNSSDLKKLKIFPSGLVVTGNIPLSISVKGKTSSVNFSANADLRANSVEYGHIINKKAGVPCRVEAAGSSNLERVTVEEAYFIIGDVRIALKGFWSVTGEAELVVDLPPKGIPSEALVPLFAPSLEVQSGGR